MQSEFTFTEPSPNSPTVTIVMNNEEWLPVPGFPGYDASTMGRFRRGNRYLSGTVCWTGYVHIGLMRNGKQVTSLAHRLIAATFLEPESPNHKDVNHLNKVRTDNRVSNLQWSTRSENSKHSKIKR